ncbi:uncharacterized protein [Drosophila suzukii]|uniref:Gag protein n=1 Tax=Drosophila suzukii TaxID=28584 RepID=A0ABM4U036_DROSZ
MPQADLLEQLAIRERQLEQLQQAYVQLQGNGNIPAQQERLFKNINRLATFTGTGEISTNSFFSSVEYLLQTVEDPQLKREATGTIFYRTIQGQAKDAVINIPEPDNWDLIKATLKLRYRPDTEPHQIYKRICDLRVNSPPNRVCHSRLEKSRQRTGTKYCHGHYLSCEAQLYVN